MFNKKTTEALQALLPQLPIMIGESSLYRDIDELVAHVLSGMKLAVVADKYTHDAFGCSVWSALQGKSAIASVVLEAGSEATAEAANYIRTKTVKCDALVAVGSGTINDLCKYTAHLDNKPYIVFPTAASMNGYLSANASITVNGYKTSFAAKLPLAVFCDYSVLTNAPPRLSRSGLGDSLARPTAQADWLLSHMLLGTTYNEAVFELLKETEQELFFEAGGIGRNDSMSIKLLTQLLLLSGLGMTIAGGSYPASQGEHMIAHTYNMLTGHSAALHGEEIAVTSLYMAQLQTTLLRHPLKAIEIPDYAGMTMADLFGNHLAQEFAGEYAKKITSLRGGNADEAIQKKEKDGFLRSAHNDAEIWHHIREKLESITMCPETMRQIAETAGLASHASAIGWNDKHYATACQTCPG